MRTAIMVIALAAAAVAPPRLVSQTPGLKVLHNFAAFGSTSDGSIPYGPLVIDGKGNLYGVTIDGGDGCPGYGCGTAFELSPLGNGRWKETILRDFASADGSPWGQLTFDAVGDLYGTTMGAVGGSGVYELSPGPGSWNYSALYTDGAGPGVVFDNLGNLFGQIGPGESYSGAIGELSPGSGGWTYSQLYSFCSPDGCPDGWNVIYPPIWDTKGNLWGTTFEGGIGRPACVNFSGGCGVIFAMTPNGDGTWTYHVVHRFASSPTDGQFPNGGLVIDSLGNFYGITGGGGLYGNGTIFQFSYNHGRLQGRYIYNFPSCMQGCYPQGTLARDSAGNLYGMSQGGTNSCGGLSCGVVYRLAPQSNGTWKYSVLVNLTETTGGVLPFYSLTLDGKGHMFGVTSFGGTYGGGTAFEITQ